MAKFSAREIASVAAISVSAGVLVVVISLAFGQRGSTGRAAAPPPDIAPPPVTRVVRPLPPAGVPRTAADRATQESAPRPAPKPASPEPRLPAPATAAPIPDDINVRAATTRPPENAQVVVLVSGAVARPGLYALARGARVADAIRMAGGATALSVSSAADLRLNRVLRRTDQVHVPAAPLGENRRSSAAENAAPERAKPSPPPDPPTPRRQQRRAAQSKSSSAPLPAAPAAGASAGPPPVPAPGAGTPDDAPAAGAPGETRASVPASPAARVNLNTADAVTLQKRLGIGPLLAARIIAYRREVGSFKSPEQLLDVRGMTEAKFNTLQGRVHAE